MHLTWTRQKLWSYLPRMTLLAVASCLTMSPRRSSKGTLTTPCVFTYIRQLTTIRSSFMKSLNPFICVLDPALHTITYVRERSSFLLTVILAAAARSSNPQLHPDLHKHSEKLFVDSFARNAKSTEVIQAIVLSTYWKQPDDTRSWSTIGYCIRLCMELGWHKLAVESDEDGPVLSELERRQKRNVERTWFVLFVYDRRYFAFLEWLLTWNTLIDEIA